AGDQNPLSASKRSQHPGVSEILIDEWIFRAVGLVLPDTREIVTVVFRELTRPEQAAGLHIERDDRITGIRRRIRVIHTGTGVNDLFFQIECRRRPDSYTGRP